MINTVKQLVTLVPLTLILVGLLSYNFMSAQWAGPTMTAPSNNTAAPIHTGSAPQDKLGVLGVNALAVFGSSTFAGQPNIEYNAPTIKYTDTDHRDFWAHVNSDRFYILADRNDNGDWNGESPWPMEMNAGLTPVDDYTRFSNSVHAVEYCDETGSNCFDPGQAITTRTCPSTQFLRGINPDGTLVCAAPATAPTCTWRTQTKTASACSTASVPSISCGAGWSKVGGVTYTGIRCQTSNSIRYEQNCVRSVCI
jgi:hypothetical protein